LQYRNLTEEEIMAKESLKAVRCVGTVLGCIESGYSALSELASECHGVVDNCPDSLQQTDRIQSLEQSADTLEAADDTPEVPEFLHDLEVIYFEDRRKSKSHSRATRCSEAVALIQAAQAAIDEWIEANDGDAEDASSDEMDEAQTLSDDLENFANDAEGCEFPGMMG
jgi:hypothetical protein